MSQFRLSAEEIDCDALREEMRDVKAGALATFEGRVRDHNEGQTVTLLEYEAYGALALKEGTRILEEARERFAVYDCVCVHRTGALALGEVAVWVGATAKHRDAAFAATRWIIDEIKKRVPIWKNEHYAGGETGWVNCAHGHGDVGHADAGREVEPESVDVQLADGHCKPSEAAVFAKQVLLPEVGAAGQKNLRAGRVLVIGAGGLGCPALLYLAGAGVGTIGVCDGDTVEISNLHRQVLFSPNDIGKPKATVVIDKLGAQFPLTRFVGHHQRFDESLLADYDLILDCSDNFETKFALNRECRAAGKDLIQASVYQFEGQLLGAFADGSGQCLHCLWRETPDANCVGTCTESGIIGATVGVFGSMQAMEAIKVLTGMNSQLRKHVVFFDLHSLSSRSVKAKVDPACGHHVRNFAAPTVGAEFDASVDFDPCDEANAGATFEPIEKLPVVETFGSAETDFGATFAPGDSAGYVDLDSAGDADLDCSSGVDANRNDYNRLGFTGDDLDSASADNFEPADESGAPRPFKLDPLEMSTSEFRTFELVDIRELDEDPSRLIGSLLRREVRSIPLSTIDVTNPGLDRRKQYLFICAKGGRSDRLVSELRARGFRNTFSLAGGLEALRRKFIA